LDEDSGEILISDEVNSQDFDFSFYSDE
jgi:hypothetical protein